MCLGDYMSWINVEDIRDKVSDIFFSIQGEGKYIGMPSLFIRFNKCNLKCSYCDTDFTRDSLLLDKIGITFQKYLYDMCNKYHFRHLVFTGGEPLLFKDEIVRLTQYVYTHVKNNKHFNIKIETNGTLSLLTEIGSPYKQTISGRYLIYTITQKSNYRIPIHLLEELLHHGYENIEVNFKYMIDPEHVSRDIELILSFIRKNYLYEFPFYLSPINTEKTNDKYVKMYDGKSKRYMRTYLKTIAKIASDVNKDLYSKEFNFMGITPQLHKFIGME